MGKHERLAATAATLGKTADSRWHPCYAEYFRLFNAGEYYAAHDILEHIWLRSEGARRTYYKALIQFAGAFVHLRHHHREPSHRVHARRLRPAARLFLRSAALLDAFPAVHEGNDVARIRRVARETADTIARRGFTVNPWSPQTAPRLAFPHTP